MYFTEDDHVIMTYDEYDAEEAIAQKIYQMSLDDKTPQKKLFYGDLYFPRVSDIERTLKPGNLKKYFLYFFFYYVQKIEVPPNQRLEYEASMKLIKKIINNAVIFAEESKK